MKDSPIVKIYKDYRKKLRLILKSVPNDPVAIAELNRVTEYLKNTTEKNK